jgi:superfamily II DNA or RNA helicase
MFELRDYQKPMVEAVIDDFNYYTRLLLMAATGTGKTVMFLEVIKRLGLRTLVIAHMDHLIEQPFDKASDFFPSLIPKMGRVTGKVKQPDSEIIVATIQTLQDPTILERIGTVDFIVIDEAHHVTADTYQTVMRYYEGTKILGVTATPMRPDKMSLKDAGFEWISARMTIVDAIKAGALVPFQAFAKLLPIETEPEFGANGKSESIGDLMDVNNIMEIVYQHWKNHAANRQTVMFTASVRMAYRFSSYFESQGIRAVGVDGKNKNKGKIIEQYRDGEYQVLFNNMLLTEGYDAPETSCVGMLGFTKSDLLYAQRLGRGLRIFPDKKDCIILDFAPKSGGRDLIMAGDLVEGIPKRVREQYERAENGSVETWGLSIDDFGEAGSIDPFSIITEVLDLLGKNPLAWAFDGRYATATVREKHLVCIVVPDRERIDKAHEVRRERGGLNSKSIATLDWISKYRLYEIVKPETRWQCNFINSYDKFQDAQEGASETFAALIEPGLAHKKKRWRKKPASDKQMDFLHKLGAHKPGLTSGEAATLITKTIAINKVKTADNRRQRAL